jgi:hypothetical protein
LPAEFWQTAAFWRDGGKSQLKADIFNLVSGHYSAIPALTGKKIT